MKIEQLIVQHLYNNKKVTLQDIGTFILHADVSLQADNDKEGVMPENAVSFQFNKKAAQDEELIEYIVSQTRKIKPLATSDLESYSILAKQFLNIGKPFPIEGLGVLLKNQAGTYEFTQGIQVNPKLEPAPSLPKEKVSEEISFSTTETPRKDNRKWIYLILLLLIISAGAVIYYFLTQNNKDSSVEKIVQTNTDSTQTAKDTMVQPLKPAVDSSAMQAKTDSVHFAVVIKEYPTKFAADRAFSKLTSYGHKVELQQVDSVNFKIAMQFATGLSDTTRARDSLKILFGGRPYVEIK